MTSSGNKPSWGVMPSTYARWQGGYTIDLGGGLSVAPTSSSPHTAPAAESRTADPQAIPMQGAAVGGAPAPLAAPARSRWTVLCLPVYPWMMTVGALAYALVSAPRSLIPFGLHQHIAAGIAAAVGAIWLYRLFMAFVPTALMLTVSSTVLAGAIAWLASDGRSVDRFASSVNWRASEWTDWWSTFRIHAPVDNGWVIGATLVIFAAHIAYWWHRRAGTR